MDNTIKQVHGEMRLTRCGSPGQIREVIRPPGLGGVADHGKNKVLCSRRHRAKTDLYRGTWHHLSAAQPDGHVHPSVAPGEPARSRPGNPCGRPALGRHEHVNSEARQFASLVAEHFRTPLVDQYDLPVFAGQRQAVA
jgi:hypothetical protein